MFKNGLIRLTSVLLLVWYLFTVVGFDIHHCSDSSSTYVRSLVAGISCEAIHPDTPCHHHHHGCSCDSCQTHHDDDEDCEDTVEHLSITGDGYDLSVAVPAPAMSFLATCIPAAGMMAPEASIQSEIFIDDGIPDPPGLVLSLMCILRV